MRSLQGIYRDACQEQPGPVCSHQEKAEVFQVLANAKSETPEACRLRGFLSTTSTIEPQVMNSYYLIHFFKLFKREANQMQTMRFWAIWFTVTGSSALYLVPRFLDGLK